MLFSSSKEEMQMKARFLPLQEKRGETLRVLVVSDTHGDAYALSKVLACCGKIDAAIHLGDFVGDAAALSRKLGDVPCAWVRGNCDSLSSAPNELVLTVGGARILAVHGHEDGVKYGLTNLYYRALETESQAVLYGHTHISAIDREGAVWLVNPGSASRPRLSRVPTCAILQIKNGKVDPGLLAI